MSNEKVIELFLDHKEAHTPYRKIGSGYTYYSYRGCTLTSVNNKLINYSTIIAYFESEKLYLNTKKYSVTTSKIQSKLLFLAKKKNINIILYEEN